jgi:hypothetical protein
MTTATLSKFKGLDTRKLVENSDPRTASVANNLDLTLGMEWTNAPRPRKLMTLHPQSRGLYAIGGTLRSVIPGGRSYPVEAVGPVRLKYDQLGFGIGLFTSVTISATNSNVVQLEGAELPVNMIGRTLTFGGETFTVLSVQGQAITLSSQFLGRPGLHTFTLTGSPALLPRTCTILNGTNIVTITNGVWPLDIDNTTFSVTSRGFSGKVLARISNTQIALDTQREGGDIPDSDFQLNGVAVDYPDDTIIRVTAVESVGANASFGVYPYLVIERWRDPAQPEQETVFEHHWITRAAEGDVAAATQVALPFSPGPSLLKAAGKLWAGDDVNGVVRFSSTANGPSDWITAQDAGYIPVITHASGDRRIQGLGTYDDKMAVIFADSVQLWAVDPQPSNITLVRVINGPGTDQPRSVVNVLGDLFYATKGGFRSLHTATITGQIQEQDDIGAPVDELVKLEEADAGLALWSQVRGQYLCAFGQRVYAFKYSPKSKVQGWTTWELGIPVDAVAELGGNTYIRSGNDLYLLDKEYDDGAEWELVLNSFGGKDPFKRKRFDFLEVAQRGTCDTKFYLEPDTDQFYLTGPRLVGTTLRVERVFMGAMSRQVRMRFTGRGPWTLAAIQVAYLELGV